MTADWTRCSAPPGSVLVANLPYNVATPLVADLLDGVPAIARLLVMVQREVAERLAAAPGTPAYGAVSVKVAYWATRGSSATCRRRCSCRGPNVESALVEIVRHEPPATDPDQRCSRWCDRAFGQRRKMLRRSLAGVVDARAVRRGRRRPDGPPGGARPRRVVPAHRGGATGAGP